MNAASVLMSDRTCATVLFLMGMLYSVGVFSATAIVLDTCLAILVPLRYATLWPVSRTYGAIAATWAVSVVFPSACVGVFLWYHATGPCNQLICSLPVVLALTVSHSRPLQVCMLLTVTGNISRSTTSAYILLLKFLRILNKQWSVRFTAKW